MSSKKSMVLTVEKCEQCARKQLRDLGDEIEMLLDEVAEFKQGGGLKLRPRIPEARGSGGFITRPVKPSQRPMPPGTGEGSRVGEEVSLRDAIRDTIEEAIRKASGEGSSKEPSCCEKNALKQTPQIRRVIRIGNTKRTIRV